LKEKKEKGGVRCTKAPFLCPFFLSWFFCFLILCSFQKESPDPRRAIWLLSLQKKRGALAERASARVPPRFVALKCGGERVVGVHDAVLVAARHFHDSLG
jgi:hypothetical protein